MNYYLEVLKKYAVFSGRASRSEYWYFGLFHLIVLVVLSLIDAAVGTYDIQSGYGTLSGLYILFTLLPSIAVGVRRLHDIGKSGWMMLINFIPFIGGIWFLILSVTDSAPGENKYGPNPKVANHKN